MEDRILKILEEMNDEITDYKGDNLYKDGLLDSIQVVELVTQLEDAFAIDIDPALVVVENFANKETIIKLVKKIVGSENAG